MYLPHLSGYTAPPLLGHSHRGPNRPRCSFAPAQCLQHDVKRSYNVNALPKTTIACTTFALLAFAGNSVLCRLALGGNAIDAASFTVIRLLSGIVVLTVILATTSRNRKAASKGSWLASLMLMLYAVTFSFAYLTLATGTGALILFGAVQLTMIFAGIRVGERPPAGAWFGILLAVGGFIYLIFPGLTAPSPLGAALMTMAGIAWGLYSLKGRKVTDATATTMGNFVRTVPFALMVSLVFLMRFDLSSEGAVLAILSGAITSGIGYVIWYAALPGLASIHAATVQLSVPVLAALGGTLFLSESLTLRLLLAAIAILCGIAIVLWTPVHHR